MTPPFWNVLGLEPTTDETAIRRAYAAKLRVTNPEDDGDGFKALREAYENALGHARYLRFVAEHEARNEEETEQAAQDELTAPTSSDAQEASAPIHVVVEADADFDDEDFAPEPIPEAPDILTAPPDAPTLSEHERERRDHDERCRRFAQTLQSQAPFDERLTALHAVLKSPALAQVDVYTATEQWLGHVMLTGRPMTDDLIDRVIGFFRWDEQLGLGANDMASRVIYMRERMQAEAAASRILERIKDPRHEYHAAYKELLKAPSERNWFSKQLALARGARVAEFLNYVDQRAPILFESMNWEAVEWWRRKAPKAQSGKNNFALIAIFIFAALVISSGINRMWNGPAPSEAARTAPDSPRASLSDLLEQVRPPMTTAQARRDCTNAIRDLRRTSTAPQGRAVEKAEESCAEIVNRLPASLLMHQYAGIAALRAQQPQAALEHFDHILAFAPNDAYALYGRGLVRLVEMPASEIFEHTDISNALALDPAVKTYFDTYRLTAPDIAPAAKKPRSPLLDRAGVPHDKSPEQVDNPDAPTGPQIGAFFALTEDLQGEAQLSCLIGADGMLRDCLIERESTPNIGLGEVALYMADWVRYTPAERDGEKVDGVPLKYTIRFGPPETPEPEPEPEILKSIERVPD